MKSLLTFALTAAVALSKNFTRYIAEWLLAHPKTAE